MKNVVKNIFQKEHIIQNLFLIFCALVFILASYKPFAFLMKIEPTLVLGLLFIAVVLIFLVKFVLKKINLEKKWIEYTIVILILFLGIGVRIGANYLLKTEPISDFNTPHAVYLEEKKGEIFLPRENTNDLSFYQTYYGQYPAWWPYKQIIGGIYNVVGYRPNVIKIVNYFVILVTMILAYIATKKMFGKKIGIIALLLFAFFPTLVIYSNITTPDHFTILFFTTWIITWIYLLQYRKENNPKKYIMIVLNVICCILINLFKPLSVFGLLVFLCAEFMIYFWPAMISKGKRKEYFQKNILLILCFIILYFSGNAITNKILNRNIERTIHNKVVDSTSLYLLWAYSLGPNGHYNPDVASSVYSQLMTKYNKDQQKVMDELSVLAKQQFKDNLPFLPRILQEKFNILFVTDTDSFYWANSYQDKQYQKQIEQKYERKFVFLSNTYNAILYLLIAIALIREAIRPKKHSEFVFLGLILIGYILILLLGGVQSRYKSLIAIPICITAASCLIDKKEEETC